MIEESAQGRFARLILARKISKRFLVSNISGLRELISSNVLINREDKKTGSIKTRLFWDESTAAIRIPYGFFGIAVGFLSFAFHLFACTFQLMFCAASGFADFALSFTNGIFN